MGKSIIEKALPIAAVGLGAGALGAGPMAGLFAGGGSAGAAAAEGAGSAAGAAGGAGVAEGAGGIQSAGLMDMGGGNFINPDYFVGENLGTPIYTGASDLPLTEKIGNAFGHITSNMGAPQNLARIGQQMMGKPQQQSAPAGGGGRAPMQPQAATQVQGPYTQNISNPNDINEAMQFQRMLAMKARGLL